MRGKVVIGCLIVEKINITKVVLLSSDQTSADLMISNDNNIITKENSSINHPLIGIRQIWVNEKFRKQKVANNLVDSARKNFLYGIIIPRDAIAFSQPTGDGQAFGLAYTKNDLSSNSGVIWAYA